MFFDQIEGNTHVRTVFFFIIQLHPIYSQQKAEDYAFKYLWFEKQRPREKVK